MPARDLAEVRRCGRTAGRRSDLGSERDDHVKVAVLAGSCCPRCSRRSSCAPALLSSGGCARWRRSTGTRTVCRTSTGRGPATRLDTEATRPSVFASFAVNMALQYTQRGRWRDYRYGEVSYIVLSLAAKSALAWLIYANVLRT
ncbi:hypothetical protein ACLQ3B_05370 [Micromonospora sp. DT53]|uniref:hypothetical protein n=1 Tax=Micromonospora sp. DT53 TaxID=3393444 RepID=UPI003CECB3B2